MLKYIQLFSKWLLALSLCILIVSCSKLTQENFAKIKPGMTTKEVIDILGEPTTSESVNMAGLSGTSSIWKNDKVEIDIQFFNDKVTIKSFSKITPSKSAADY